MDETTDEIVTRLARPEVHAVPVFATGPSDERVRRDYGVERVVNLSNNENPLGASPAAARTLHAPSRRIASYPDPLCTALRAQLSQRMGVAPERIAFGNGLENLIEILCQTFLSSGDRVLTLAPAFPLHDIYPRLMGAVVDRVHVNAALGFDVGAWIAALTRPLKMVLFSNPSNPVGCVLGKASFARIINATPPDAMLVIDEAYYEYAAQRPDYPDSVQMLSMQSRPWMVLRTFSKAYGLAGLRIGYGVASDARIVQLVDKVRSAYNVNCAAQDAALAALHDEAHMQAGVAMVHAERERLFTRLRAAGLGVGASCANYLFVDAGVSSAELAHRLLSHGVMVKAWQAPGYERFFRVSIGVPADNDLFVDALLTVLKSTHR